MINKIKDLLNKVEKEDKLKDDIIVDLSVEIARLKHELLHKDRKITMLQNQRDVFHSKTMYNKIDIKA